MNQKLKTGVLLTCLCAIVTLVAYILYFPDNQENDGLLLIDREGRNQLHLAVLYGCGEFQPEPYQISEIVTQAIRIVKDVNLRDKRGNTALHYTCSAEVFRLLIDAGADPRLKNKRGQTVLMKWIADALKNYEEGKLNTMLSEPLLKVAIDNGLAINAQDKTGKTALHYLIEGLSIAGGEDVLKHKATLIGLGADPNIMDFKGEAPSLEKEPVADF